MRRTNGECDVDHCECLMLLLPTSFAVYRILYAKLEFSPEERFSESAKSLLSGLINRYVAYSVCCE